MEVKPQTPEEKEKLKDFYKMTFSTDFGQKVLEDLEKKCYYRRTTFAPQLGKGAIMVNEGMRNVILYIKSKLQD